MKILFLLFILAISMTAAAQDSTNKKPGNIYKAFFGWKMDGSNLNERELKKELYKTPAAIPHYKKASSKRIIGCLLIVPAVTFFVVARKYQSQPFKKDESAVFNSISAASSITGIIFLFSYLKNSKKAIRLHNDHTATIY